MAANEWVYLAYPLGTHAWQTMTPDGLLPTKGIYGDGSAAANSRISCPQGDS